MEQTTNASQKTERDKVLMQRVCDVTIHGKRSPLCNNRDLYRAGKAIFEARGVPRDIAMGIMYAESHIGINYAGICDASWNNWGGVKARKLDDGSPAIWDQPIPNDGKGNKGGCRLYRFNSIEDYFVSKANTLGIGYKSCFSRSKPITCISYAYVGNPHVAEQSWIRRVAKIAY